MVAIAQLRTRVAVGVAALTAVGVPLWNYEWTRWPVGSVLSAVATDEMIGALLGGPPPRRQRAFHCALAALQLGAALGYGLAGLCAAAFCTYASVMAVAMSGAASGATAPSRAALSDACAACFAHAAVGLPFAHAGLVARGTHGVARVFLVLAATVAGENAALLAGTQLGGPHLAPALSPNKRVSGLAAQVLGSAAVVAACGGWAGIGGAGRPPLALTGAAIGAASAAGDLAESWVKRCVRVKDMGSVLPATGGFMDRLDGLLWAYPAAALLFSL